MNRTTGILALALAAATAAAVSQPLIAQSRGNGPDMGPGMEHGMMGPGMMGPGMMGPGMMGPGGPAMSFETFDTDGDGSVTTAELLALRQQEVAGLDADQDGLLSPEEIAAFHMRGMQARADDMAARMITERDLDGDGRLGVAEMVARPAMTPLFERLDANDDDAVSEAEFEAARAEMRARMDRERADRGPDRRPAGPDRGPGRGGPAGGPEGGPAGGPEAGPEGGPAGGPADGPAGAPGTGPDAPVPPVE